VSGNRVLKTIFGPKREDVEGGWRRLHNAELHNLYASPKGDQMKEEEMGGTCNTHGRDEKCVQILVEKPKDKRPLGRPRLRWKDKLI
jgi:hypothetical protein